jgi:hypothetical protein
MIRTRNDIAIVSQFLFSFLVSLSFAFLLAIFFKPLCQILWFVIEEKLKFGDILLNCQAEKQIGFNVPGIEQLHRALVHILIRFQLP